MEASQSRSTLEFLRTQSGNHLRMKSHTVDGCRILHQLVDRQNPMKIPFFTAFHRNPNRNPNWCRISQPSTVSLDTKTMQISEMCWKHKDARRPMARLVCQTKRQDFPDRVCRTSCWRKTDLTVMNPTPFLGRSLWHSSHFSWDWR